MTSTTSRILYDVANHYNQLIVAHRKLDKEIEEKYDSHQPDHVVKALKMNKLHLKQQIEDIRSNLQAMIKQRLTWGGRCSIIQYCDGCLPN